MESNVLEIDEALSKLAENFENPVFTKNFILFR